MLQATTIAKDLEGHLSMPSSRDDKLVTLTKSQKQLIAESAAEVAREKDLLCSTMTRTTKPSIILAVVPWEIKDGYMNGFATLGVVHKTNEESTIDRMLADHPRASFAYFEDSSEDRVLNQHEKAIREKVEALSGERSETIVAGVAPTSGREERRLAPARMRGGLAAFCDNEETLKLVVAWANDEHVHVRCVEDLTDADFAGMLKYGSEGLYLERAMTAFVGTADERAEQPALPPMEGDQDTGAP